MLVSATHPHRRISLAFGVNYESFDLRPIHRSVINHLRVESHYFSWIIGNVLPLFVIRKRQILSNGKRSKTGKYSYQAGCFKALHYALAVPIGETGRRFLRASISPKSLKLT